MDEVFRALTFGIRAVAFLFVTAFRVVFSVTGLAINQANKPPEIPKVLANSQVEKQLQNRGGPYLFESAEPVVCPSCSGNNEPLYDLCFWCGEELDVRLSPPQTSLSTRGHIIFSLLVVLLFSLYSFLLGEFLILLYAVLSLIGVPAIVYFLCAGRSMTRAMLITLTIVLVWFATVLVLVGPYTLSELAFFALLVVPVVGVYLFWGFNAQSNTPMAVVVIIWTVVTWMVPLIWIMGGF